MYVVSIVIIILIYVIWHNYCEKKSFQYQKQLKNLNLYKERTDLIYELITFAETTVYDIKTIQKELNDLKSNLIENNNINMYLDKFIICSSNLPELNKNKKFMYLIKQIQRVTTDIQKLK